MRFLFALWAAKAITWYIGKFYPNRGTNLPGRIALKIDPLFVKHIKGINRERTVFLTGTNGKSTTTNVASHILRSSGYTVCTNKDGANMLTGVATALLKDCTMSGKLKSEYVVMETDERYLSLIHKQLPAKYITITNIQKDQFQRNGEPSYIFDKIRSVLTADTTVIVNQDDPRSFALKDYAGSYVRYGVRENALSYQKEDDFFAVSIPCPKCSNPIHFKAQNIENIGPFHCTHCDYATEEGEYVIDSIDFDHKTFTIGKNLYVFPFTTPYFAYCYISAIAIAKEFGLADPEIQVALETFQDINHRIDTLDINGKELRYIKMKEENSETMQSGINLVSRDEEAKAFMIAFSEDVGYFPPLIIGFSLFDCDLRVLKSETLQNWVCFSPYMAKTLAVRFFYDGFDADKMILAKDVNDREEFLSVVDRIDAKHIYLLDEIPFCNPSGAGSVKRGEN